MKDIKKRIDRVYKSIRDKQNAVSSELDYFMYDNIVIVDFGNPDARNPELDEWMKLSKSIRFYNQLTEKLDELRNSNDLESDYYAFIEKLNLMFKDYVSSEEYELAGIILKCRKRLKKIKTKK